MFSFNFFNRKIQRIELFAEHCNIIEAYLSAGQAERALAHLIVLKNLYANEVRKIINIK